MNLPFKKIHRGFPTYFPHKVLLSLVRSGQLHKNDYNRLLEELVDRCPTCSSDLAIQAKHHTIRSGDGWQENKPIHFIINNRTKDRYQFAPIMTVKRLDDIVMTFDTGFDIQVNGNWLDSDDIERLALNDGFDSVDDMAEWFFPNEKVESFSGKIIHWTDIVNY